MSRARWAAALLNLGGALMLLGATLDLTMARPPAAWHEALGGPVGALPAPVARLLLALVHALGGSLFAGALAVVLLANGPVRRGDRAAGLAIAAVALVGEGGNGPQMVRAGLNYGWGVLAYLVPVGLGLLLAYVPTPAFGAGARQSIRRPGA